MSLTLYGHPFSSYVQKALMALYENGTPFEFRLVDASDPATIAEFTRLWPIGKMPLLVDDGAAVPESSLIVEHLDRRHPGPVRLVPKDENSAQRARLLDRVFDNYVQGGFGPIVADGLRPPEARSAAIVAAGRALLDRAYPWLEGELAGREWALGETFSLADCSAAPALFYADWVHPIDERFANLKAYRARLNARPSFARCIEEARPYRAFFPLGAPDQD